MPAPAVIIPWRNDRSQSLRFMLRSLVNLPHGEVVVVGDEADWLIGVTNIVRTKTQRYAKNHESVFSDSQLSRLEAAAYLGKGYAYLADDDMFIMQPVDWVAPVHRGLMPQRAAGSYWYEAGHRTARWLQERGVVRPKCFEVHVPLLVDVERLLGVADEIAESSLEAVWLRSVYGNLVCGRQVAEIRDPKVSATGSRPHPTWPIWSTADEAFNGGLTGKMIRRQFFQPSPYERLG